MSDKHLEDDVSYRRRLLEYRESPTSWDDPRAMTIGTNEIAGAHGRELDTIGERFGMKRRLVPMSLEGIEPENLALGLLSISTTESANLSNSLLESERHDKRRLEYKVDQLQDDLLAVAKLHRMLSNPGYARRLIQMLSDMGPLDKSHGES